MTKNRFLKKMGAELLELCEDLALDPECLNKGSECFDNRMRLRSLNELFRLINRNKGSSKDLNIEEYKNFFASAQTILHANTQEEVRKYLTKFCELHGAIKCNCLEADFENGEKVLRQGC